MSKKQIIDLMKTLSDQYKQKSKKNYDWDYNLKKED